MFCYRLDCELVHLLEATYYLKSGTKEKIDMKDNWQYPRGKQLRNTISEKEKYEILFYKFQTYM